jgi:predicted O-linked N-acetylglucosamine transferase (SPINDLY family)
MNPQPNPAQLLQHAFTLHQAGRLAEAEPLYREVLRAAPRHADALHLLGVLCYQTRRLQEAVELMQQAVAANPAFPNAFFNLGVALKELGRVEEAINAYRQALAVQPTYAEAHLNLGALLKDMGQVELAIASYQQALVVNPNLAEAHYNLGVAFSDQGRAADAEACYRRAVASNANHAPAHFSLGGILREQGRLEEAVACYQRAIALKPDHAKACFQLGDCFKTLGRLEEAAAALQQAVAVQPDFAEAHWALANCRFDQRQLDEAMAGYQRALQLAPDLAGAHYGAGNVWFERSCYDQAATSYRRALAIYPDYADAYNNLGNTLQAQGRTAEAIAEYRRGLAAKPDFARVHSNLLFALNYSADVSAEQLFAEHRAYEARHALPLAGEIRPHGNERDPERRLRVGYVSPDFRRHPTGCYLESVLAAHDRAQVEIFCYSDVRPPGDEITARFKSCADLWRDCRELSDEALAAQIRQDRIDLLVDLAGHTAGNRLLTFARKPALVQVAWLGYFNTTGLSAIDYGLWDPIAVPEGNERRFSEQVLRLPHTRFCYTPPDYAPPVAPPPLLERGAVTYGCFNNLAKITPDVVALWAQLLQRVADARLVLKWGSLQDSGVQQRYRDLFRQHGIDPARIELRGASPHPEMLAEYRDIDIALDPFPFSGGLTSCEALWMGVPVVTLAGKLPVSRQTLGFLSNVGLPDLAATDTEQYLAIAAALGRDRERLSQLRQSLRARMAASPLCDAHTFARDLEAAYRQMWGTCCAQAPA